MRFISKYGRFGVQLRPIVTEAYATGAIRVTQEPIYAMFEPYKLTPIERELALQRWSFNGSLQEQDEVTMVPPDYRIGLFDSEQAALENGWDPETHAFVVAELCKLADAYDDILVARIMVAAPWPRYDEFSGTPQALVRRLVDDGHDLEAVLLYEEQNQNRPKIITEIAKAIDTPLEAESEPEEVVVG